MITLKPKQIFEIAARYTQLGYMEAVRAYMPLEDYIKEKDVKRWFKVMNVPFSLFKSLTDSGEVECISKGKSPKVYYSKVQIMEKIAAVDVMSMIERAVIAVEAL